MTASWPLSSCSRPCWPIRARLVREVMAIAGWIAAAVLAFIFAPQVEPLVSEIPVVGDFLGRQLRVQHHRRLRPRLRRRADRRVASSRRSFRRWCSARPSAGSIRAWAFFFGVARGILLVAIAFFVYDTVHHRPGIHDGRRKPFGAGLLVASPTQIESQNPEQALGWITPQYEDAGGHLRPVTGQIAQPQRHRAQALIWLMKPCAAFATRGQSTCPVALLATGKKKCTVSALLVTKKRRICGAISPHGTITTPGRQGHGETTMFLNHTKAFATIRHRRPPRCACTAALPRADAAGNDPRLAPVDGLAPRRHLGHARRRVFAARPCTSHPRSAAARP